MDIIHVGLLEFPASEFLLVQVFHLDDVRAELPSGERESGLLRAVLGVVLNKHFACHRSESTAFAGRQRCCCWVAVFVAGVGLDFFRWSVARGGCWSCHLRPVVLYLGFTIVVLVDVAVLVEQVSAPSFSGLLDGVGYATAAWAIHSAEGKANHAWPEIDVNNGRQKCCKMVACTSAKRRVPKGQRSRSPCCTHVLAMGAQSGESQRASRKIRQIRPRQLASVDYRSTTGRIYKPKYPSPKPRTWQILNQQPFVGKQSRYKSSLAPIAMGGGVMRALLA